MEESGPGRLLTCHRCSGIMERGFVADTSYGCYVLPGWSPGEPETSIWSGLKVRKSEQRTVSTYRCKRCGVLESYA